MQELAFGWPSDPWEQQAVKLRLPAILEAVDLTHIQLSSKLTSLSDGYKRRVALAVQLARSPSLLLLDEPLAGLDWRARADVAGVLSKILAPSNPMCKDEARELRALLCAFFG